MSGWSVAHLDGLETLPGPGTLTWHPVRAHFGLRAFGANAYSADEAGRDVVEPHTEDPDAGHQELPFVARGRATFTLDGEPVDAPAGTYVFVRDPAVHRHAVAAEAGTTVLSFGGPPVFTPSAWEWSFRAHPLVDRDPAAARELVDEGLRVHPRSPGLLVLLARLEARAGRPDAARAALDEALGRDPEAAEMARDDPRLAPLLGGR